jgi:hypothetical protein
MDAVGYPLMITGGVMAASALADGLLGTRIQDGVRDFLTVHDAPQFVNNILNFLEAGKTMSIMTGVGTALVTISGEIKDHLTRGVDRAFLERHRNRNY